MSCLLSVTLYQGPNTNAPHYEGPNKNLDNQTVCDHDLNLVLVVTEREEQNKRVMVGVSIAPDKRGVL